MKRYVIYILIMFVFAACKYKTNKDLLENKWLLLKVSTEKAIQNNFILTKWLEEQNTYLKENSAVTEYSPKGYFLCYENNRLLKGEGKYSSIKDMYMLLNEKGNKDESGNIIIINLNYEDGSQRTVNEEILYISEKYLLIKSYAPEFIKFTNGYCFIFTYRRL